MTQYEKAAAKSALFKIKLQETGHEEYDTIFIAQSAVDAELVEAASLSAGSNFPTGHLLDKRVEVVPDVTLAKTTLSWRELTGEKHEPEIEQLKGDDHVESR